MNGFARRAEYADQQPRTAFYDERGDRAHGGLAEQQQPEEMQHAVAPARAHVVARYGNAAGGHADYDGDHDLEEFHHDAHHRHRDLSILRLREDLVAHAVFLQHVVDGRHGRHQRDLRQKRAYAEAEKTAVQPCVQMKAAPAELYGFHAAQIADGQRRSEHLSQHRGHRGAHHAPLEAIDEQRVEHHVYRRASQRGGHGKFRAAIRTNDGVHRLAEHVEGNAQRDPEEVFLREFEGFVVYAPAEYADQRVAEDQVKRGKQQTGERADDHRVAHAAVRVLTPARAQTQAHERAAAVADHDRDGERDYRERIDHRVGGVSGRAQIGCVGNENLIYDVVQRRHQQRYYAGHGVFAHQLAHGARFEMVVGLFLHFGKPPDRSIVRLATKKQCAASAGFTQMTLHTVSGIIAHVMLSTAEVRVEILRRFAGCSLRAGKRCGARRSAH